MTKEEIKKVLEEFVQEDGTIDLDGACEALVKEIQPVVDELAELKEVVEKGKVDEEPFKKILSKYDRGDCK